jgi:hypothetical protein
MGETQKLLAYDAQTHGVSAGLRQHLDFPSLADSVQCNKLLNLALNSMEAMQGQPPRRGN